MEDCKTELIKQWQYRKDHFFIFGHDGLSLKKFLLFDFKLFMIQATLIIAVSVIFGLIFGLITDNINGCIKGWFIFLIAGYIIGQFYRYILYLNYIEIDNPLIIPVAAGIISLFIYRLSGNIYLTVGAFIAISIVSIMACKATYYEKQNNLQQFLKENGVDVNEET